MIRDGKVLVQVEQGVWVDPMHVVAVLPIAIGTRGFAKIMLDTGESIQCCEHEVIIAGKADPEIVENSMKEIIDAMNSHDDHLVRTAF